MKKRIKNIVFDLGGVLVDHDRQASEKAFVELGFDVETILDKSAGVRGLLTGLEMGENSPEEFYDFIIKQSSQKVTPEQIDYALNQFLQGIPNYKLDMVRELKEQYNIFMLSNTNIIMYPYIVDEFFTQQGLTVDDYFDRVYLSYEMKLMKPDEQIYQMMLSDSGAVAAETLFIDDLEQNVRAAERLGIYGYLAKPREDFSDIFDDYEPL